MVKTYLDSITFDRPYMLWLLLLVPLVVAWAWWRSNRQTAALLHPSVTHLTGFKNLRITLRNLPLLLRGLALALVVAALARPARYENIPLTEGNGIDIVLCLDISGSMLARDFQPDRLRASHRRGQGVCWPSPRRSHRAGSLQRSEPVPLPAHYRS